MDQHQNIINKQTAEFTRVILVSTASHNKSKLPKARQPSAKQKSKTHNMFRYSLTQHLTRYYIVHPQSFLVECNSPQGPPSPR